MNDILIYDLKRVCRIVVPKKGLAPGEGGIWLVGGCGDAFEGVGVVWVMGEPRMVV